MKKYWTDEKLGEMVNLLKISSSVQDALNVEGSGKVERAFTIAFKKKYGVNPSSLIGSKVVKEFLLADTVITTSIGLDSPLPDRLEKLIHNAPRKPAPKLTVDDILVINISDCHFGSHSEDTVKRFEELPNRLNLDGIGRIYINMLGDIVDGESIHANQPHQQDISEAPYQIELATECIWNLCTTLSKRVPVVLNCVIGNHGRTGRRKATSRSIQANFDMWCYRELDCLSRYSDFDITLNIGQDEWLNTRIGGVKWHLRHIAPKQGSTAAGEAKFMRFIDRWDVDVICYGHLHSFSAFEVNGRMVFRCPTSRSNAYFGDSLGYNSNCGFQWIRFNPSDWPDFSCGAIVI